MNAVNPSTLTNAKPRRRRIALAALLLSLLAGLPGCAHQYHWYPPCHKVPCDYCPPPPLPYHVHCGCPCGGADSISGCPACASPR